MKFKMFFQKVVEIVKFGWLLEGLSLARAWLVNGIKKIRSRGRLKLEIWHDCVLEFYYRRRRGFVERSARICDWFIALRNDIRLKLDEIFEKRLIKAQTQHPIQIQADVQQEATWMFFRTTHPVITTDHLTFNGSRMQLKKQTPLVRALFKIPGVAEVALMRYNVRVTRGSMFSVNDLTPKIMKVLREHLV